MGERTLFNDQVRPIWGEDVLVERAKLRVGNSISTCTILFESFLATHLGMYCRCKLRSGYGGEYIEIENQRHVSREKSFFTDKRTFKEKKDCLKECHLRDYADW